MTDNERDTRPQAHGETPAHDTLTREEAPRLEPDHMREDRAAPQVANEAQIHRQADAHGSAHDPLHVDNEAPLAPLRGAVADVDTKAAAETHSNELKQAAANKNLDPSG